MGLSVLQDGVVVSWLCLQVQCPHGAVSPSSGPCSPSLGLILAVCFAAVGLGLWCNRVSEVQPHPPRGSLLALRLLGTKETLAGFF